MIAGDFESAADWTDVFKCDIPYELSESDSDYTESLTDSLSESITESEMFQYNAQVKLNAIAGNTKSMALNMIQFGKSSFDMSIHAVYIARDLTYVVSNVVSLGALSVQHLRSQ